MDEGYWSVPQRPSCDSGTVSFKRSLLRAGERRIEGGFILPKLGEFSSRGPVKNMKIELAKFLSALITGSCI